MNIVISTSKKTNKPSRKWVKAFVFFGIIPVIPDKNSRRIPSNKLVVCKRMETRVCGNGNRLWCNREFINNTGSVSNMNPTT